MAAQVTITFSDVIAQVKRLTAFEGRDAYDANGESKFERIEITGQDEPLVLDYVNQAVNAAYQRLERMIESVSYTSTTSVTWTMRDDTGWQQSKSENSLKQHIQEAIAAYTMEKWITDKQAERAPFYRDIFQNTMLLIEQNAYAKGRPSRPTY